MTLPLPSHPFSHRIISNIENMPPFFPNQACYFLFKAAFPCLVKMGNYLSFIPFHPMENIESWIFLFWMRVEFHGQLILVALLFLPLLRSLLTTSSLVHPIFPLIFMILSRLLKHLKRIVYYFLHHIHPLIATHLLVVIFILWLIEYLSQSK